MRERWFIAAMIAAILAGAGVGLYWVFKPRQIELFSDLEPGAATRITNDLALAGIPGVADEPGHRVLVPARDAYRARIQVMERGLPSRATVGFELFDHVEFGMTDFAQRINYQRALEGELARTITALEEVDQVRVHLVLPEPGLFRRTDEGPKASLTVGLKPATQLRPVRVMALQRLVAAAVPGLKPDAVAIVDLTGRPLEGVSSATGDDASNSPGSGGMLEMQRAIEDYLAKKAQLALDAAVGGGRSAVVVNVELEHGDRQRHRETVLPVGAGITGAVRSLRSWGGRAAFSEALQPLAGVDVSEPVPTSKGRDSGTEVQYEVGREIEDVRSGGSEIKRLTVGIVVHNALADAELPGLSDVVAKAIGLDPGRGDQVAVHRAITSGHATASMGQNGIDSGTVGKTEDGAAASGAIMLGPARLAAAVFGLLLVAFFSWRIGRRGRSGSMDRAERERLLAEVRTWLAREPSSGA